MSWVVLVPIVRGDVGESRYRRPRLAGVDHGPRRRAGRPAVVGLFDLGDRAEALQPFLEASDQAGSASAANGCVAPTAVTSPWYGPTITQLFAGAWSFHAMNAPLDLWIDDLVVDTKPVACPAP